MKQLFGFLCVMLMSGLSAFAQVGINTDGSVPNNSAMLDVKSSNRGLLPPRMTHAEINAIVNPANGLIVYCTDCGTDGNGAFFGYINGTWNSILTCIPPVTPAAGINVPAENQVIWNWNTVPGATGYRWNTTGSYATATDVGVATTKTETGLTCNTPYARYAWAYNACGISAPVTLSQTTSYVAPAAPVAGTHTASPVQVVWNWNTVMGATGYKWNTSNNYGTATDMGLVTTKTETGLTCNMAYTRYIWAYSACGNSLVTTLTQSTSMNGAASVTIAVSANPVCSGTAVTFTATPVNGGVTPAYQWIKGGTNISGATNATYSYIPAANDAISCRMTSSIPCSLNNPATSNTITITVNSAMPVSITIAASANPVCAGTSVTFTATPSNGGTTPLYQWKKGGTSITGATNVTYSYIPLTGDAITCQLTSNATCPSGNPATSNTVTMTVNPLQVVGVSIAASANPVCAGTSVTFTATPSNGGTTPLYQWKKGGTSITGATNVTYSYIPLTGDAITCQLTSNATCPSGNPATSNTVTMTVNPLQVVGVSISASANPVCAGTSVTFTATPSNGGTTPLYQWKKGGTNITGASNATYSYIPLTGDAITCQLTSNATCPSGNPATSNTVTMTVNPLQVVGISIAASANPVCAGVSVTFTATPSNGGTTPLYQWKKGGTNITGATNATYSYIPLTGDAITCQLTSNATCPSGNPATSNTVTMTVNPLQVVGVSISASANPVCAGTSVTFTATPSNGGTTPLYQWKKGGTSITGATNATYSYIPINTDALTCVLTSNAACPSGNPATSNIVTMTVNPAPVTPAAGTHVPAETQVEWNWNTVAGATGYKWNTTNDYATATDMGSLTTKTETGLTCNTPYVRYAWAYNGCGNSTALTMNQSTSTCPVFACGTSTLTINHLAAGGVAPVDKTTTYGTVTNIPGELTKCWITSNLGSDHQATSVSDASEASAGWYWQFNKKQGYKHDGTTRTPNTTWITAITENSDWTLVNDPCNLELGTNWHTPTYTEWYNVKTTGVWSNPSGPWNSGLKIHNAGFIRPDNAALDGRGISGDYWSNTQGNSSDGWEMGFWGSSCYLSSGAKAMGLSIRCIQGNCSLPIAPSSGTHSPSSTQIIWNWNTVAGATGYKWNTTNDYATATDMGSLTTKTETGLTCNTPYVRYAWAYNGCGNSTALTMNQSTSTCPVFSCGQPLTDIRDGKSYNTVLIGTQCWFAQNLNVGTKIIHTVPQTNNATIEKYCYNDDDANCVIYGGLYQWEELMNYTTSSSANPSGRQGLCPTGWHLPSHEEWCQMEVYLDATVNCNNTGWQGSDIGFKLKESGTVHWAGSNAGSTNSSGFTALPAGYRDYTGVFDQLNLGAYFWTTTEMSPGAWHHVLNNILGGMYQHGTPTPSAWSGRCVKD